MFAIGRKIHFITAAVSCRRPFIGHLIALSGAIPVERPQDLAKPGPGKIVQIEGETIKGAQTKFSALK